MRTDRAERYAPYPLTADAAAFGLRTRTVLTPMGVAAVHSSISRSGPTALLLLHGAAGSWSTWTPLLRAARELDAALADIVAVDLPGWGSSPLDSAPAGLALDVVAESIRACVSAAGYSAWRVVGHSMGGLIALHLAARFPEQTRSVGVISGTGAAVIAAAERPFRQLLPRSGTDRDTDATLPAFALLLLLLRAVAPVQRAARATVRALERTGLLRVAAFPLFRHPLLVPRSVVRSVALGLRPVSFVRAALLVRRYRPALQWAMIAAPVTAISGDRDVFVGAADAARFRDVLPSGSWTVFADCGHYAHVEWPLRTLIALGLH